MTQDKEVKTIPTITLPNGEFRRDYVDLMFTVVAKPSDYRVDYTIYDIMGFEGLNSFDRPLWQKRGASYGPTFVMTLEEAEVYIHGEVKWDGCSNWHFDEQDRVMLHGCRREDILRFGKILAECWDWTAVLCPSWDDDI